LNEGSLALETTPSTHMPVGVSSNSPVTLTDSAVPAGVATSRTRAVPLIWYLTKQPRTFVASASSAASTASCPGAESSSSSSSAAAALAASATDFAAAGFATS
jgi:hypothetical protein